MKIARYVGDLLYDYECVVIPGLGGFLTNDKPVLINEVNYNFSPSFREIHFNVHLRTNDGLLVNYVAQQEQIGYKTAKQRVDQFVFQCHTALNSGKKINFKNIGSIYFDVDKNVVFQQDAKVNYNPNSFGLSSLVSPAIRRVSDEEKVKNIVKSAINKNKTRKKPVDRKKNKDTKEIKQPPGKKMQANRRKSTFSNNIIFLLVVAFIMGSGYIYMRRDSMLYYISQYSSQVPFFYSSVNDYLSTNINSTSVARLSRSTTSFFPFFLEEEKTEVVANDDKESAVVQEKATDQLSEVPANDENENPVVVTENEYLAEEMPTKVIEDINIPVVKTENIKISKPISLISSSSEKFFIIAGSFSKESNAVRLVSKLKNQGFDALIADTNKYGMYRVAFSTFENRATAEHKLVAIRNEANPKAWLLVK